MIIFKDTELEEMALINTIIQKTPFDKNNFYYLYLNNMIISKYFKVYI